MEIILPEKVLNFLTVFINNGYECFVVGGTVRDFLLDRQTSDYDFTTNATPEEIQKLFPESFYDNSFGTVGVKIKNKNGETEEVFEVTTYRKEGSYSDGRHPDSVSWGKTIEEDLARRDFTINAMAIGYDVKTKKTFLVDPYNGTKDIDYADIRAVGDPNKRFGEDALRLMRAIRLATQLAFKIEDKTWEAIVNNHERIKDISSERVRDELVKILSSDFPADGIRLLYSSKILGEILPEITAGVGVTQIGTHHKDDVFMHSLKALEHCRSKNWVVRFATLIHDVGKPPTFIERNGKATFYNHETVGAAIAKKIADRLHFSKIDREKIYILVRWHMFSVSEFLTDAAVRRFIKRIGKDNTEDMLDLRIGDRLGSGSKATSWRLEDFKKRVIEVQKHVPSVTDLLINGKDIMEILKIGPGPKIGQILNQLFEEIMEDPSKNEREYLIKRTLELA